MSLTWDFYRLIDTEGALGGCVHYYDTSAQSLYLSSGMISQSGKVKAGNWSASELRDKISVVDTGYTSLELDHPHNGTVYGIASTADGVHFLRYVYANDLSDIFDTGQWTEQVDNQVKALSLSVKNVSKELFASDNSLFNPGAKITIAFAAGDSEPYDIGIVYLDDVDFDVYAATVPVGGRNSLGYYLTEQSFDDKSIYSGGRSTVFNRILIDAGIPSENIYVKEDNTSINLEFEPESKILEGLNDALASISWRMIELPNGNVVIGDETHIASYSTNGRYTFSGDTEAFKRKTHKSADAAYTRVCVVNSEGTIAVYKDIPVWDYWFLGSRKTKYYTAPEGYTEDQTNDMADSLVEELQYVGIGEQFASPIRPQLQVGDVAEIYYEGDVEATSLGILTEVKHQFGGRGYSTDFSLDSGGTATDVDDYTMTKMSNRLSGYNRKQRILDFMTVAAERKVRTYSGGGIINVGTKTMPQAVSISPASLLRM